MCHELKDVDEYDERSQMLTGLPLSSSPEPMSEEDEPGDVLDEDSYRRPMKRRKRPFLPNSRLRDMEAMLDSRHSRSSFAKLLETESAVRLFVLLSDSILSWRRFRTDIGKENPTRNLS